MKILICALYGRSGMLHYASELANSLSKDNEVYVILPDYSTTALFSKKIKLIRINAPASISKTIILSLNPLNFSRVVNKIKAINPDVIHFTDNHPWYLVFLPFIKKYPLVVTQHDVVSHPGEMLRGRITNHVNNVLNKVSKRIVVHGKILKGLLVKKGYPESKIVVMYIGGYIFFLKGKKKGLKTDKNNILFFGRILKYKGVDTLLKAMPIIKQKIPGIKLTIAGEGNMSPYQEYITGEIRDNVEIINRYFEDNEVAPLFQKASIIVIPYIEASYSGLILLSYTFKKALIGTNVGTIPEIVEDGKTGILIPPNNPQILAEKVIELIRDNKKRIMIGRNGYRKIKTFLNWDYQTKVLMEEYKKIVNENKAEDYGLCLSRGKKGISRGI